MSIPAAIFDSHVAILGKTGSGKTFCAKGLVERLLDQKRQVCVVDPTGAWWGLRLAADGKGKGYDVILLGGERGDLPLAPNSGAAVARLVTEQRASVLDTSGMTVGEYTRWFIDFAGTLFTTIRSPLNLVIDEAHHFMPQGKVPDPDTGKMLHAGNRLMSGGRSRGIRGMLITQRPQKLHKDSLTCADTLIAMRVVAPQDRKAYEEWINGAGDPVQGKTVIDSLAQLPKGEGWVWYPEGSYLKRITFPPIKTYDSSATPKAGDAKPPAVGEINLDEVKASLADAVAAAEANDPKKLKAKIAALEAELKKKPAPAAPTIDQEAIDRAVAATHQHWRGKVSELVSKVNGQPVALRAAADTLEAIKSDAQAMLGAAAPVAPVRPITRPVVPQRPAPPRKPTAPAEGITPRQQRFLDAAATLTTLGAEVSKDTVCGWVGVHPRGGSVGEELKALHDAGLVLNDRGRLTVTAEGHAAAGYVDPAEAIERAKSGLSNRQAQFFDVICEAYPADITKEQIAERFNLHPRGGSLGEDLSRLVGRGLVEGNRGRFKAREFLFAR